MYMYMYICICIYIYIYIGAEKAQTVKNLCSMQKTWVRSELGRCPGEGNGNSLQYSCLENSMDRDAWWATVHGESAMTE